MVVRCATRVPSLVTTPVDHETKVQNEEGERTPQVRGGSAALVVYFFVGRDGGVVLS